MYKQVCPIYSGLWLEVAQPLHNGPPHLAVLVLVLVLGGTSIGVKVITVLQRKIFIFFLSIDGTE